MTWDNMCEAMLMKDFGMANMIQFILVIHIYTYIEYAYIILYS